MSLYQHGKRTARQKDRKIFLKVAFVFAVALIGAAWILHKDLATDSKERTTVPIVTNVSEEQGDTIDINEPLFTMKLPSDWKLNRRVQEHYANFYEWQSTRPGANDRILRLHIDILPASYKVVRLQSLIVNGNRFTLGSLSDNCRNFAQLQDNQNAPVEAKWDNITFICDPINANQTIGTGTADGGIAARMGGHQYFFYWEDHNIRPDDQILINAIKSFQSR